MLYIMFYFGAKLLISIHHHDHDHHMNS